MLHELVLTTTQTTEIKNTFPDHISTDIKLSKAEISKIIQSVEFCGFWLANLGKKALATVAFALARENLRGLVSTFNFKISVKGAIRAGKEFTLFISNEDMNDIIKTIKSFKDSSVLINGITDPVKHEIKKQEDGCIGALAASIMQPVISSLVKGISREEIRIAEGGYMDKNF